MGIVFAIIAVVACVFLYIWILNRGKKCKHCGTKFDSSCIVDAKIIRTVKAAMGADMSDVEAILHCKNCGKESRVKVTVKDDQSHRYLDEALAKHFDK